MNELDQIKAEIRRQIMRKVIIPTHPYDCSHWKFGDSYDGTRYPYVVIRGYRMRASRAYWLATRSDLSEAIRVHNECGTRDCILPQHHSLFGIARSNDERTLVKILAAPKAQPRKLKAEQPPKRIRQPRRDSFILELFEAYDRGMSLTVMRRKWGLKLELLVKLFDSTDQGY